MKQEQKQMNNNSKIMITDIETILKDWKHNARMDDNKDFKNKVHYRFYNNRLIIMTYKPGSLIGCKGSIILEVTNKFKNIDSNFKGIFLYELGQYV